MLNKFTIFIYFKRFLKKIEYITHSCFINWLFIWPLVLRYKHVPSKTTKITQILYIWNKYHFISFGPTSCIASSFSISHCILSSGFTIDRPLNRHLKDKNWIFQSKILLKKRRFYFIYFTDFIKTNILSRFRVSSL